MSTSVFTWVRSFLPGKGGIRKSGAVWLPVLIFLVLSVLFLSLSAGKSQQQDTLAHSDEAEALSAWRASEEEKLALLICRLEGVDACYVSVNFSSGEESVREGGVTVSFSPAQVSAVVVVYEGRDSLILKERIVDMVSTLYGIGYHRVSVNPV